MQEEGLGLPRPQGSPLLAEEAAVSLLCSKHIIEILVMAPFPAKGLLATKIWTVWPCSSPGWILQGKQ